MQLLSVGRGPLDGSIKVQTGCADQGWSKALCLPSYLHGCSLPLHADTGLVQAGDKTMERAGGDGEQIPQFLAFPPDTFTRSQLLLVNLCSAEAWQRVKSIWALGVRCDGSAALLGQPNEQSLLSLPYTK